jgi:hypothetical protein
MVRERRDRAFVGMVERTDPQVVLAAVVGHIGDRRAIWTDRHGLLEPTLRDVPIERSNGPGRCGVGGRRI